MDVSNDIDRRLADVADAQWGVVRRSDLDALGLSRTMIADRVARRRLRVLYRGVYAHGHRRLRREGEWLAATWSAGATAVLSHWSAATAWDLLAPRGSHIHVTRPSTSGRAPDPKRIRLHRVGTFKVWEGTVIDGIPTTTPARTLLDLAANLRSGRLEELIGRMDRLGVFDLVAVRRSMVEHPRQHGAPALRRLLDELHGQGAADLRSVLEAELLVLCADHGLPRPPYHATRAAFERDRERDQLLSVAGYHVLRFTYDQVKRTPAEVANRIRRLLDTSASSSTS